MEVAVAAARRTREPVSEVGLEGLAAGEGVNSPQPSTACPPRLAAWFLRHSRYTGSPPLGAGLIFLAAEPPLGNTTGRYLTPIAASMTLARRRH